MPAFVVRTHGALWNAWSKSGVLLISYSPGMSEPGGGKLKGVGSGSKPWPLFQVCRVCVSTCPQILPSRASWKVWYWKHKDFMPMFMWQPCFEHLLCARHCVGDKDMNKGGSFGVTEKHHSVGALRRPLPRCQGRLPGGGSLHWILTKEGKSARTEGWRPSCG